MLSNQSEVGLGLIESGSVCESYSVTRWSQVAISEFTSAHLTVRKPAAALMDLDLILNQKYCLTPYFAPCNIVHPSLLCNFHNQVFTHLSTHNYAPF